MMIETVLTSTVVASLVAAFISVVTSERRIAIENVTQERAKWRDRIRETSARAHKAIISNAKTEEFSTLRCEFALLLNPFDSNDQAILKNISPGVTDAEAHAFDFIMRVSLLLKHDWERAKFEALPFWRKFCCQRRKEPLRVSYEEYLSMSKA